MKMKRYFNVLFFTLTLLMCTQNTWALLSFNNQLNPEVRAQLSDKILSEEEILKNAEANQEFYFFCISEIAKYSRATNPAIKPEMLMAVVNNSCEEPEDLFNIYLVLMAAAKLKQPMSEKQAAVFVERDYNSKGRIKSNAKQRIRIYKNLGLLQ